MKARMTSKRIELRPADRNALVWKYLTTALEYENFHISTCVEPEESAVSPSAAAALSEGPVKMVPIDKLAFAHFGSLVTKACILTMMAYCEPPDREKENNLASPTTRQEGQGQGQERVLDRTELLAQATQSLDECEQIGVRQGYHFITLHAGVYLEILGLDTRRGKQLQVQALDAIQALNGPKDFAMVYDAVIEAFPILERFKIKYTLILTKQGSDI